MLFGNLHGMRRQSGYGWYVHIRVSDGHERVPDGGRHLTAGGPAGHGPVVVVAEPDTADIFAREADEPDVLGPGARSGLAGDIGEVELRPLPGSLRNDLVQHLVHTLGDFPRDNLGRRGLVPLAAVDQLSIGCVDFKDAVWLRQPPTVRKRRDTAHVLERRDAGVAECHRAAFLDALDPETFRQLDHLLAPHGKREFRGRCIERFCKRHPERHARTAAMTAVVVLRMPITAVAGGVTDDRFRLVTVLERCCINVDLEG